MENNPSAAAAAAQGLVLHALLVACARRAPGLADEIAGLIDGLRGTHEAALPRDSLPLYREELEQWKVKVQNLPEG
jgi:hypothetical protein